MLFEEALLLVGIPLVLILIGYLVHRGELAVIGGIGLLVVGVMILVSPLVVHYGLDTTNEVSHVWNCSNVTDNQCFGTPYQFSCSAYNSTQCPAVDGCEWNATTLLCSGTPTLTCGQITGAAGYDTCVGTSGCYVWNETTPHECNTYRITRDYSGTELDLNSNMLIGLLITLLGLLCLVVGTLSFRD